MTHYVAVARHPPCPTSQPPPVPIPGDAAVRPFSDFTIHQIGETIMEIYLTTEAKPEAKTEEEIEAGD